VVGRCAEVWVGDDCVSQPLQRGPGSKETKAEGAAPQGLGSLSSADPPTDFRGEHGRRSAGCEPLLRFSA